MRRNHQVKKTEAELFPQLECVTRISNIPIVETGWNYAGQMYTRIKHSNFLVNWTLDTAELSFSTALEVALPSTVAVFGGPINVIDKLVCKSLDVVEQRVPNIHLPPQMMYWQTKQYMNTTFVRPILKRADSVKEMGNSVLASKYTAFAADRLENALNVADKYVDKYLPDAADKAIDDAEITKEQNEDGPAGKAVHTIHHVDRLSRKLQRRLTKRTFAEAKALKERSQESIHVLLYVAELLATDPKQALQKAHQLWLALSENEPENQARPDTLEQLIVLMTRESARRLVHFVNFTRSALGNLPVTVTRGFQVTTHQCRIILDNLIKNSHLEGLTVAATDIAKVRAQRMNVVLMELNSFANFILERLALALAGQAETKKQMKTHSHKQHRNNHNSSQTSVSLQSPASSPVVLRNQYRATHRYANNVLNNGAQT